MRKIRDVVNLPHFGHVGSVRGHQRHKPLGADEDVLQFAADFCLRRAERIDVGGNINFGAYSGDAPKVGVACFS